MTQVQGGEKGCVEGAQESLESETILSHSARTVMWTCAFVSRTKDKNPNTCCITQRRIRKTQHEKKLLVDRDVHNYLSGLYPSTMLYSLRSADGVKGEGKPSLPWLLGSTCLCTLSLCVLTLNSKHTDSTFSLPLWTDASTHIILAEMQTSLPIFYPPSTAAQQITSLAPNTNVLSQCLCIRILIWVNGALYSSLTSLGLRHLLGLQSHLRSNSMNSFSCLWRNEMFSPWQV